MNSKNQFDALGTRMKEYEKQSTQIKFIPGLPICVRIDGRGFSKFTKKMKRPYDKRLSNLMIETTKYLVKEFNATVGYVQSDEISLILNNTYESPAAFNGKKFKLESLIASSATAFFNMNFYTYFLKNPLDFCNRLPTFDCRCWNVPSEIEASNTILWRYLDAMKNSKQMLAQSVFSHKELQGLNGKILIDKLKTEKNIIWEDYPEFFKSGSFVHKITYEKEPDVIRSKIEETFTDSQFHLWSLDTRIDVVFNNFSKS